MPTPPVYACSAGASWVHAIAEGIARMRDGTGPSEVILGPATVMLTVPSERRRRHEHAHLLQQAEHCPRIWRWLPLGWRAWVGRPAWALEYFRLFREHGYLNHPMEKEAREAEEPTIPGVRLPPP